MFVHFLITELPTLHSSCLAVYSPGLAGAPARQAFSLSPFPGDPNSRSGPGTLWEYPRHCQGNWTVLCFRQPWVGGKQTPSLATTDSLPSCPHQATSLKGPGHPIVQETSISFPRSVVRVLPNTPGCKGL